MTCLWVGIVDGQFRVMHQRRVFQARLGPCVPWKPADIDPGAQPLGMDARSLGRARGVPVVGCVGPPRCRVCHDRGPARPCGLSASRGAPTGGVRPPPPPGLRLRAGAGGAYAVPRRTRRRAGVGRGAAVPAGWGRWRAGPACACCARYSTSWSPASSNSCSWMML